MRKTESKEIDGITFTVQQLSAMRGSKLSHKIARVAGPALAKLSSVKSLEEIEGATLAESLSLFFENFSEADLEQLIRDLFETATITSEGKTTHFVATFDDVLAGKILTLYKAIFFALKVNFPDFFQGAAAGKIMAALSAKMTEAASSSKE